MRRLWNRVQINKKTVCLLCLLVLAVGLLISGISLAYFTSQDEVTNRHKSVSLEIALFEPNWQSEGKEMAKKLEPGMVIPKDPYLYNKSDADVYVRIKLELRDSADKLIDASENRYQSIMNALYCDEAATKPLIKNNISQSPDFYYYDGWFYYAKEETGCLVLPPNGNTSKLFETLKVPVLKTAYNGIFDANFTINVIGQGISTENLPDEATDFSTIAKVFDKEYPTS